MSMNLDELGGTSSSWTPEGIGDKISGTVLSIKRQQQTSFTDGSPLTWDNGEPRMMTLIDIQTDLSDNDDDDGVRTVWLKGGKNFEPAEGKGQSGEEALKKAVKDSGSTTIDEGAKLSVAVTGLAQQTQKGFQPAKLYTMKYEAPSASADIDDLFDD